MNARITSKLLIACAFINIVNGQFDVKKNVQENLGRIFPPGCGFRVKSCSNNTFFRSFDGSCTNPFFPESGMRGDFYVSLLRPIFADNFNTPRESIDGRPLPSPRELKNAMFPDGDAVSQQMNVLSMGFSQFITHDISNIAKQKSGQCCTSDNKFQKNLSPGCMPIKVPFNDPVMSQENIECINFTRALTDFSLGCTTNIGKPINKVSHFLDCSGVYGYENNFSMWQRGSFLLKTKFQNGREYLPTVPSPHSRCKVSYLTGDDRNNQNLPLTICHTLFTKQHNFIAKKLKTLNKHWSTERIFNEARRIAIAEYQFITFYEWLPFLLGLDELLKRKVIIDGAQYINDFNPRVTAAPSNEFIHVAFRYLHSNIPEVYELYDQNRTIVSTISVSENINCQDQLEEPDVIDQITVGMTVQPMAEFDSQYAAAITEHFEQEADKRFGQDLRSLDIQRARDIGIPTYCAYRGRCKIGKCDTFDDFKNVMSVRAIAALQKMYKSPEDVDLSVGAHIELHLPDSNVGPTFHCIMMDQFIRMRRGDPLFFDHVQSGFSLDQIQAIKTTGSMARILCNSNQGIHQVQLNAFGLPDPDLNPVVPCEEIPVFDFGPWKEKVQSTAPF